MRVEPTISMEKMGSFENNSLKLNATMLQNHIQSLEDKETVHLSPRMALIHVIFRVISSCTLVVGATLLIVWASKVGFFEEDPILFDDYYSTTSNASLDVLASNGVLMNDIRMFNRVVSLLNETDMGNLSFYGNGSFSYTPSSDVLHDFVDRFSYIALNNPAITATVHINVTFVT